MTSQLIRPELPALSVTELAEVLFATGLQESDALSPEDLRSEVCRTWAAGGCSCEPFVARLAQEAGDHPEEAARRMRWARDAATMAAGAGSFALAS